jgi:hypothetical protein
MNDSGYGMGKHRKATGVIREIAGRRSVQEDAARLQQAGEVKPGLSVAEFIFSVQIFS